MKKIIIVFVGLLLFCSRLPAQETGTDVLHQHMRGYLAQHFDYPLPEGVDARLYLTVSDWLGVPYRYAGGSQRGIDCSSFVRQVFLEAFGLQTSGNSRELYARSERIRKKELSQGDLVFFKIRKRQISHVGIYLGANKFAHSSRTQGVVVSDMTSPYFKKYYAGAGRLAAAGSSREPVAGK